ncbi:GIY-YIG nuclease family protein [Chimaeribacter arupi]|jgi:putative endonuclease|uniref:GIY-YIG nuclease family protein n=1 Tax=Chimaeribacter arupi TaxID=2060066 RepID=UPI000C7A39E2|nr:GIY-YIG nuclease family protein [Chimaeribacter arupi]PLR34981.1 hypothetical protein CYR23_09465 [Chimaeribacter arupi]PLR53021.1 hypothetical protein CYR52_05865 [Chimaeribacter arupi]WKZ92883.1 GIY-YIG nuclease family protein [Chimaeribacter arupi]
MINDQKTLIADCAPAALWHLYMLRTAAGLLYTGITTDVPRRLTQHQCGKGAKALRGKGPLTLVFHCVIGDRSAALKAEYRIKQLSRGQKERLVSDQPQDLMAYMAQTGRVPA